MQAVFGCKRNLAAGRSRLSERFDIVVIGGGHAGAEAAWAAANLGAEVALVTMDARAIGRMSCNPAIGGLGKGQMVCEIDALGGLMGLVTDATGIQFRMLNRSKGPAVWAPRAQADREVYAAELRRRLQAHPRITIVEGCVAEIQVGDESEDGVVIPAVRGVLLEDGRVLAARAVVITSGTFMGALMHCGRVQTPVIRQNVVAGKKILFSLRRAMEHLANAARLIQRIEFGPVDDCVDQIGRQRRDVAWFERKLAHKDDLAAKCA